MKHDRNNQFKEESDQSVVSSQNTPPQSYSIQFVAESLELSFGICVWTSFYRKKNDYEELYASFYILSMHDFCNNN